MYLEMIKMLSFPSNALKIKGMVKREGSKRKKIFICSLNRVFIRLKPQIFDWILSTKRLNKLIEFIELKIEILTA